MCKGGSSSSTIDPRIMSMLQQNYASAQNVAARPYQPYTGQLTADLTPAQTEAGSLLQSAPFMGQGAFDSGINTAASGTQYQAPQAQSGFYNPARTEAASASGFAPLAAAQANPASAGEPNPASPAFYNPVFGAAAQAGPAALATPAAINASALPLLSAPDGLAQLSSYTSPYTQNVADATMNELNRQNRIALNNLNQNAAAEDAFGGDRQAVAQALTNDDYARAAASALAGLNNQGFNTAAGLLQNNQQMGLNASGQNLNAALSAAGQTAANQQQANLANAAALNNLGQFNANLAQATGLANLGYGNQAAAANAGAANQAGLFNAGAANNMAQFNAGNAQQTALANMGARNNMGQFDLSNLLQSNQFNAGLLQQANQANAAAANTAAQFDLGQSLQAALANQGAANAAQGLNLQSAGLLGNLGAAENSNYLNGVNALNAFGAGQQQTEQNALNAAYQQYLNQFNYPVQMQQLLNAALSGGLGAGTYNPTAAGQATGGLLGGLGSLGSAAALLLPLL